MSGTKRPITDIQEGAKDEIQKPATTLTWLYFFKTGALSWKIKAEDLQKNVACFKIKEWE